MEGKRKKVRHYPEGRKMRKGTLLRSTRRMFFFGEGISISLKEREEKGIIFLPSGVFLKKKKEKKKEKEGGKV